MPIKIKAKGVIVEAPSGGWKYEFVSFATPVAEQILRADLPADEPLIVLAKKESESRR